MSLTKTSELREMSDEQLNATLKDARTAIFRLRIKSQMERLDTPTELLKNRKLVSKIKTVQRERELDVYRKMSDEQLNATLDDLRKQVIALRAEYKKKVYDDREKGFDNSTELSKVQKMIVMIKKIQEERNK